MRTVAAMEVAAEAEAGAYQEMLRVVEACASRIRWRLCPQSKRCLLNGDDGVKVSVCCITGYSFWIHNSDCHLVSYTLRNGNSCLALNLAVILVGHGRFVGANPLGMLTHYSQILPRRWMRTAAAMEVAAEAGAYQEMLRVVEACASRIRWRLCPQSKRRLLNATGRRR
ncbi:hypothetical protein ZWY2020_000749 [Hordeum vulgare]|nr:hypothetical protein ZWY2020_000749 [Hordeum vulgare]